MSDLLSFVTVDDVEIQSFRWGKAQRPTDPGVTDSQCMVSGIVTLAHGRNMPVTIIPAAAKICSFPKAGENR